MSVAQRERAALVEILRAVGPDAPTLCEGWTTRDLVAHLVVRERRPDALPGLVFGPLRVLHRTRAEPACRLDEVGGPGRTVRVGSAGAFPVQGSRPGGEHPRDVRPP